ncbi:hypothetical protein PROFUN_04270 [Planoprotostelium fungivorum]|uniref:Uncharacterized protein n=1 Tax=Planoprotostelium fungivorum TaxID=1890364 RepID=A0A2P6NV48_9EUKA|nr:hypothetical protein PROFUN_04270 [Planoprotostelium fungivorum]
MRTLAELLYQNFWKKVNDTKVQASSKFLDGVRGLQKLLGWKTAQSSPSLVLAADNVKDQCHMRRRYIVWSFVDHPNGDGAEAAAVFVCCWVIMGVLCTVLICSDVNKVNMRKKVAHRRYRLAVRLRARFRHNHGGKDYGIHYEEAYEQQYH